MGQEQDCYSVECPCCEGDAFNRAEPLWAQDEEEVHECGHTLQLQVDEHPDGGVEVYATGPDACYFGQCSCDGPKEVAA